ncbi:unnamed protein product, partial [Adineta steineri]
MRLSASTPLEIHEEVAMRFPNLLFDSAWLVAFRNAGVVAWWGRTAQQLSCRWKRRGALSAEAVQGLALSL